MMAMLRQGWTIAFAKHMFSPPRPWQDLFQCFGSGRTSRARHKNWIYAVVFVQSSVFQKSKQKRLFCLLVPITLRDLRADLDNFQRKSPWWLPRPGESFQVDGSDGAVHVWRRQKWLHGVLPAEALPAQAAVCWLIILDGCPVHLWIEMFYILVYFVPCDVSRSEKWFLPVSLVRST